MRTQDESGRTRDLEGPPELLALLPEVPDPGWGDGYDWMDLAERAGWFPAVNWGREGWDMGNLPYVIVLAYSYVRVTLATGTAREAHGVLTYVEGDLTVQVFPRIADQSAALDGIAHWYWRHSGGGPDGFEALPGWDGHEGPVEARYCGPFSWARSEWEKGER